MTNSEMKKYAESAIKGAEGMDGFPGASTHIRLGHMILTLIEDNESLEKTLHILETINGEIDPDNLMDEVNGLTEQNKLMRDALKQIVQMPTGEDVAACIIEEVDALAATGEPK